MKTIQVEAYEFGDLSDKAKQKVINWLNEDGYRHHDEAIDSLKEGFKHFDSCLRDYDIDYSYPNSNSYNIDVAELSDEEIEKRVLSMGSFNPENLKGHGDCVFTGVCFDEDFADGVREAYFGKLQLRDLYSLLKTGCSFWAKSTNMDYEYQFTNEYAADLCETYEYLFDEHGNPIHDLEY